MPELDILEHAYTAIDRMWTFAQWYVGISLAVVTAGHFAAERLNIVILVAMIGLYSAYTVLMGSAYVWNFHLMNGYLEALAHVDSGNTQVMQPVYDALAHPSGSSFAPILYPSIGVAVYIACTAFLIRTYIQERGKRAEPPT